MVACTLGQIQRGGGEGDTLFAPLPSASGRRPSLLGLGGEGAPPVPGAPRACQRHHRPTRNTNARATLSENYWQGSQFEIIGRARALPGLYKTTPILTNELRNVI